MATGGIENDSEWQQIQEEITCSICGDIFCDPKTIPCLHTFCKECLEKSIETSKKMAGAVCCPLCRALLPKGDLNIPTNFRIKRFIEIFQTRSRNTLKAGMVEDATRPPLSLLEADSHSEAVHGCGKCEKDLPAVTWCVDCQVSLCFNCNEVHTKWKDFKVHETTTIQVYLQNPKRFISSKQKPRLPKNDVDSYTCKLNASEDHVDHKVTNSDESVSDLIEGEGKEDMKHTNKLKTTALQQKFEKMEIKAYKEKCQSHKSSDSRSKPVIDMQTKSAPIVSYPLFMAKYDYSSEVANVLNFKKGDLFHVINKEEDWWFVRSKDSGNEGYIPSTYIVEFGSLGTQE